MCPLGIRLLAVTLLVGPPLVDEAPRVEVVPRFDVLLLLDVPPRIDVLLPLDVPPRWFGPFGNGVPLRRGVPLGTVLPLGSEVLLGDTIIETVEGDTTGANSSTSSSFDDIALFCFQWQQERSGVSFHMPNCSFGVVLVLML